MCFRDAPAIVLKLTLTFASESLQAKQSSPQWASDTINALIRRGSIICLDFRWGNNGEFGTSGVFKENFNKPIKKVFISKKPFCLLQELSSQLREVQGEWSSWSEWSACSRSCDGGVSHQLRHCHTSKCFGEPIRYKICNMQVSS